MKLRIMMLPQSSKAMFGSPLPFVRSPAMAINSVRSPPLLACFDDTFVGGRRILVNTATKRSNFDANKLSILRWARVDSSILFACLHRAVVLLLCR